MTTFDDSDGGAPELRAEKTERGFVIYNFTDRYGFPCSLQRSSIATEDCIWLGVNADRMHLTPEMVAALLPALTLFAAEGILPDEAPTNAR
jgi:hypothetical protein